MRADPDVPAAAARRRARTRSPSRSAAASRSAVTQMTWSMPHHSPAAVHDALGREAQRHADLARLQGRVGTALVLLAEGVDDGLAILLGGRLEDGLDEHVLVLVLGVGDQQRRAAGALDVLRPAAALRGVQDDVLGVGVDPDERRVDRSVLVERRDVAEVAALDELAHRVGQGAAGHRAPLVVALATIRLTRRRRLRPAARCGGRSASRARCSSSSAGPPRCSAGG